MKRLLLTLSLTTLLFIASPAVAEELNYNLVNLNTIAQKQIDNDILLVTMRAASDSDSAQEAAGKVNQDMTWALGILGEMDGIKKQTQNYQTSPRYKNKVIIGWSVSQQLRIESDKIEELSTIVGKLQERLMVSGMGFEASLDRKKAASDGLISQALARFNAKAQLVTSDLGAKEYRIVNLTISENSPNIPRMRDYQMEAMPMSAAAPQVKAGESKLTVQVDGTIQLVY